jgi:precorrin-8X/cobalt-precorrin-8 methylmutase
MPEILDEIAWCGDPVTAGRAALERGAPVLADAGMVEAGITRTRLPAGNRVACYLGDPRTPEHAAHLATTRSAAAVDLWQAELEGAVVAIGNAPTALFHLLERLSVWDERPAMILAFPVGFVGAAESKQALIESGLDVPFVTLRGRRGGSAMAAAAVNALAREHP